MRSDKYFETEVDRIFSIPNPLVGSKKRQHHCCWPQLLAGPTGCAPQTRWTHLPVTHVPLPPIYSTPRATPRPLSPPPPFLFPCDPRPHPQPQGGEAITWSPGRRLAISVTTIFPHRFSIGTRGLISWSMWARSQSRWVSPIRFAAFLRAAAIGLVC